VIVADGLEVRAAGGLRLTSHRDRAMGVMIRDRTQAAFGLKPCKSYDLEVQS
jgi:hypothetical protein